MSQKYKSRNERGKARTLATLRKQKDRKEEALTYVEGAKNAWEIRIEEEKKGIKPGISLWYKLIYVLKSQ